MSRDLDNFKRDEYAERKQLGQIRPLVANTPVEIYSPRLGVETTAFMLTITNDSNQDAVATAYHDDNGTTYDRDTRIGQKTVSKGAEDAKIGLYLAANNSAGSVAVESSAAGDLTFTLWGIERPKK